MKVFIKLLLFLPLLFSCQEKYNKPPYDDKEKEIRKLPDSMKILVLDSLWQKRDSLSYLKLQNVDKILIKDGKSIPDWIFRFKKLKWLIYNGENIKLLNIPNNIGKLRQLQNFNVSENSIENIPLNFYNIKSLKNIEVDNNNIHNISKSIKNLKYLESIEISNNPLSFIPKEICELPKLESLVLENTQIKELPKCLGTLQNLDWINVSGTQLTAFPVEILNAPKLKTIHAKNLKLKNYKEIEAICKKKHITFYYDE